MKRAGQEFYFLLHSIWTEIMTLRVLYYFVTYSCCLVQDTSHSLNSHFGIAQAFDWRNCTRSHVILKYLSF